MSLNMDRMRKHYNSQQENKNISFKQGDTLLYIHPPCRNEDKYQPTAGLNYVPIVIHYNVGKNRNMVVCLDNELNSIITHPFVKEFLEKRNIKLSGKCPICEAIDSGSLSEDESQSVRAQVKYLWGATIIALRERPSDTWNKIDELVPSTSIVGKTIYDGFMNAFFEAGDITDFKSAILVKVNRKGKGITDTKYTVNVDTATLRKAMKLNKTLLSKLKKALKKGGEADLFREVAYRIKAYQECKALLSNIPLEEIDENDILGEDDDGLNLGEDDDGLNLGEDVDVDDDDVDDEDVDDEDVDDEDVDDVDDEDVDDVDDDDVDDDDVDDEDVDDVDDDDIEDDEDDDVESALNALSDELERVAKLKRNTRARK